MSAGPLGTNEDRAVSPSGTSVESSRSDWRTAFRAGNPAGGAAAIRQKTWSALSAVVREMSYSGAAFEGDRSAGYARLLVMLDEVGGRIHCSQTRKPTGLMPDAPHRLYYVPGGAPFWTFAKNARYARFISLQFNDAELAALVGDDFAPDLPQTPRVPFFDPRLLALARTFEAECAFEGPSDPLLGEGLSIGLLSLLQGVGARASQRARRGGLTARELKKVTDYLQDRLAEKIDSQQLAALTGLSPAHFHRAFKVSTGLPPHAWLLDLRLRRARELMLASDRSLAEVALETGFSDQPHFTRMFSRRVGASPAAWRRSVSS